ncbi:hypothetical protein [Paracoccus sp. MC1862]|uniref:hypothetical protein n=2 Tax=Paracoccus TaxID=265 RepID=UPI002102FB85|nr:hypothetical protein [Paracoccus sp. MC1862]
MFLLMIAAPTLAGVGIIIMLALGHYDWRAMLSAAAIGAVAGFPVAWLIARNIQATDPKDSL